MAQRAAQRKKTAVEVLNGLRGALEEEDFLLHVSCWAWEYCQKFPREDIRKWEHPLEFTKLHNEYRLLFENKADEYLDNEELDLKDVLEDCQREMAENPGPMTALVDALAASEDYLAFCRYMQQIRIRRDWAEGRDLLEEGESLEDSPYAIGGGGAGDSASLLHAAAAVRRGGGSSSLQGVREETVAEALD